MYWQKTLLIAAVTSALTACGASSSSPDAPGEPVLGALPPVSADSDSTNDNLPPAGALACAGSPEKWVEFHDLRIYQVMTEAFIDGNPDADMNVAWGNSAHKGDIAGITQSLDYIANTLNMNAIWLTPVFRMVELEDGQDVNADRLDGTGYFASNYFEIDPRFGTVDELRDLVDEAHSLGLYVFLDGVFGHFKENAHLFPSPEGQALTTSGPVQSDVGRVAEYPEDLAFYQEVIEFWTQELRIDGWRLDQADQVPPQYWQQLRNTVQEVSQEVAYTNSDGEEVNALGYMVAEVFDGNPGNVTNAVYGSDNNPVLCSAFNFQLQERMRDNVFGTTSANAGVLRAAFDQTEIFSPEHALPNTFLGNHDIPRFGDILQRSGVEPDESAYYDWHKLAFSFMSGISGPMTLYYGEEIGDEVDGFVGSADPNTCGEIGRYCEDHVARNDGKIEGLPIQSTGEIFQANAQQQELRNFVANLMQLREDMPELARGERNSIAPPASLNDAIYIDHKAYEDRASLVMLNVSEEEQSVSLSAAEIASLGNLQEQLLDEQTFEPVEESYTINMPALSARILNILEPNPEGFPEEPAGDSELTGEGPLAACDTPDSSDTPPLDVPMFIRGSFSGGGNFGETPRERQFSFKGDGLYQVVVNEPEEVQYTFKFAGPDFQPEFAVQDSALVMIGTEQVMAPAVGPGTESSITIPEAGDYVFSFRLNDTNDGGVMMVSLCP